MRTLLKITLPCLLIGFASALIPLKAQTAKEIMQKSDDLLRGKTSESEVSMTIIRPDWSRTIQMKSWSLDRDYSLTVITEPVRDKGTVFLKRKNEIWNWVPSIGRSVKLPPSMMMQSWMGSDFTNDDLVRESSVVNDYEHEILSEEDLNGTPVWKLQLIPKPDAPVVWGKVIAYISKGDFHQLKTEFYDEDGYLVNTLIGFNIKKFGDRKLPSVMEMIPADKEGHKTRFEYITLEFDKKINASFFSIQNMKKIGG